MADPYDIGDIPQWTYLPKPVSGVDVSTAVEFTVIAPNGTPTVYTHASPEVDGDGSTGWVLTLPTLGSGDVGLWTVYAKSTAGVIDSKGAVFVVQGRPSTAGRARTRWPIVWPTGFDLSEYSPLVVDLARDAAEAILWALTGRRFGTTTTTEKYRIADNGVCGVHWQDDAGLWYSTADVARAPGIRLVHTPVREIVSVSVAGSQLVAGDWFLNGAELMRTGGWWPTVAADQAANIVVTYKWGEDLPSIAQLAMGEVAAEFLTGFTTGVCKLPSGIVTIARQGVTKSFDPTAIFADGRIGLPIADAWIKSDNPSGLRRRSRVYSPDLPRRVG